MEREIKFKAKVIGEDKWTFSNGFLKFADGTITIIVEETEGGSIKTSPIQKGTLKQFTGFEDDHNIEIYDGDFIERESGKSALIDFRNGAWVFIYEPTCGSEIEGECHYDNLSEVIKHLKIKVIGNDIDNPELLNV